MQRLLAIALLLAACKGKDNDEAPPRREPTGPDPCAFARAEGKQAMKWIKDDLRDAVACSKSRKQPIVIDEWAPWCHTCLSMQTTVFPDPSFAKDADRFVFLALDTDKEQNADAVARYPPSAWPTFYVVGTDGAVLARFVGAASLAQFHAFLDAGARAVAGGAAGADAHLLGAERALAIKDLSVADQELTAALAAAPADWARRPDALVSLALAKQKRHEYEGCAQLAEQHLDETGSAAAVTDFIVNVTPCIEKLPKSDEARAKKLRERAAARLAKLVDDQTAPLSIDDRADAMANLRELDEALGKKPEAKAVATRERTMLDDAAAKAATPIEAMTYNWPRAEVYAYLGVPLELVPALEKSAKDLPDEYDPRARLGWIYLQAGKLDDAVTWTNEALRMVYGPRKARVLTQRAEIAAKQKDAALEKKLRKDIVTLWESLPPGQASPEALSKAREVLAALDAPPDAGVK